MALVLFTLIGDVVGSRRLPDRPRAQSSLGLELAEVNRLITPRQPMEPTVGDEFQGAFDTLSEALLCGLLVRLALLPLIDVRCGVGLGEITVHDGSRRPLLQDGPGWWSAREALETLSAPRRTSGRTWYVGEGAGPTNAYLLCRDQLIDRLSDRGRRMLRMALLGQTQQQIAEIEGISKSAVSQQFARGVGAIRDAQVTFGREE
ncbi:MAG TPA: SatD family protein [Nocardioidaceae bacterium]|nr:SatD family protein [Nocardioidaceae bacterium]